jgi:hypothetical protein
MLLCENASLSRLSIRIFVVPASVTHINQTQNLKPHEPY